MKASQSPSEGDTPEIGDGIRYERAWVCRNGGCDPRELVDEA